MRLRLTKVDEYQFLTCLKHEVWGSKSSRFKDWKVGDKLAIIVNKAFAGLAEVCGKPYSSKQRVWDNGMFPHRIPLKFSHILSVENRPPVLGEIRDALTSTWGNSYGWGILNQQLLTDKTGEIIVSAIRSRPNVLEETITKLDTFLADAKRQREAVARLKNDRKKRGDLSSQFNDQQIPPMHEISKHSSSQDALVRLGKVSGCSVWIAANDKNRIFKGKSLGEGCLRSLPRLGLSEEAVKRISLIDVIWIRQNAPVCAFEVEATTSIYSGLLRMADLLSVVPALNIKLFIVALRERQEKVMSELARPTFMKIGLSDYCRFIAEDALTSLYAKVSDLEGHVHHSIIDTISVELEDKVRGGLE